MLFHAKDIGFKRKLSFLPLWQISFLTDGANIWLISHLGVLEFNNNNNNNNKSWPT
jgi:hypothetical protein